MLSYTGRHACPRVKSPASSCASSPLPAGYPAVTAAVVRKQHRQRCTALRSAYTQEAIAAIRSAQQEACKAGSMFVTPAHLLLGLTDQPDSQGCQLLLKAGLTAADARGSLVDRDAIPFSSSMGTGDMHWAPESQAALATAAQEAGQAAAGTPHLLLGVVTCGNAAVTKVLQKADIQVADFAAEVRLAAENCTEGTSRQPASGEDQAADLVQKYQQYVAQHGTAPPAGQSLGSGVDRVITMTPEDDDYYN